MDVDYSDLIKRADAIGDRTKRGAMASFGIDVDLEIDKLMWSKVYADRYSESMGFDEFYYGVVPIIKMIKEL